MLRFWLLVSVCLSALFTLVGAALSREWGWSEYASDELYVVYRQYEGMGISSLFLLDTNGSSEAERLALNNGETFGLDSLDCSPDGQTLALLTENEHLYVITSAGIAYERVFNQHYEELRVANNGIVTLFNPATGGILVDSTSINLLIPPVRGERYYVDVSSERIELWMWQLSEPLRVSTQLVSSSREPILSLPDAIAAEWLASEKVFSFGYMERIDSLGWVTRQYLMDINTGVTARLMNNGDPTYYGTVSPDATKMAFELMLERPAQQIYLADTLSGENWQQLTHSERSVSFRCFLTFRPEILLSEVQ